MQTDEHSATQTEAGCPFLSHVADIRRRARQHIQEGAVTPSYAADRETVLRLLNEALATELVCVLRYKRHYFMAGDAVAGTIRSELWRPRLSKRSIEYQPARPKPIWTIQGQMSSGRALIVTTRVALKIGRCTISSPGMLRCRSSGVAPHLRCHGRYRPKNATATRSVLSSWKL